MMHGTHNLKLVTLSLLHNLAFFVVNYFVKLFNPYPANVDNMASSYQC